MEMDFGFEDEPAPQQQKKGKKRFRKNKLKLVFDSDERRNFLLGFRKRKQERKEKYIEKLERDLAKEKKRIRQQTERASKKLSNSHAALPEVQNILDTMPEQTATYDLGNTLVSITSLDDQAYRKLPLPGIKEEDEEEEDDMSDIRTKKNHKKNSLDIRVKMSDSDDEFNSVTKNDPFFNPVNDDEISISGESSEEEEEPYNPLEMLKKQTGTSEPEPGQKTVSKAKLEREANRLLQSSDAYKKMQKVKQKRSKKFRLFRLAPTEDIGVAGKKKSTKADQCKGGKKKGKVSNMFKGKHGNKKGKRK